MCTVSVGQLFMRTVSEITVSFFIFIWFVFPFSVRRCIRWRYVLVIRPSSLYTLAISSRWICWKISDAYFCHGWKSGTIYWRFVPGSCIVHIKCLSCHKYTCVECFNVSVHSNSKTINLGICLFANSIAAKNILLNSFPEFLLLFPLLLSIFSAFQFSVFET